MMAKIIYFIFVVLYLISCTENNKNKDNSLKVKTKEEFKTIFGDYDLFRSVDETIQFVKDFKMICKSKYHQEDFDIENVHLDNTRQNIFITDKVYESIPIDYFERSESITVCYIYNDCRSCRLNSYGYILWLDRLIVNVTESTFYYIKWKNIKQSSPVLNSFYEISTKLDSTATEVITNIDPEIIRKTFNYKGEINLYKIDKLHINMNQDIEDSAIFEKFIIEEDSLSYIQYKNRNND